MGVESEIREALTNLDLQRRRRHARGRHAHPPHARTAPPDGRSDDLRLVHIEVSDTGVGMDEETRRRCLEPFFTTKGERGTGLGLAMVYGMVQRHSADIEIESAPGKGTTVRLSFGRPDHRRVAVRSRPDAGRRRRQRLRILVVDDDPLRAQGPCATP